MPREERFGIGKRIDELLLDLLETLRKASFASAANKLAVLTSALGVADSLRFFLQIAWENRLLPAKHYEVLSIGIEEVGRMTNGWRKGFLAKTPPGGGERER